VDLPAQHRDLVAQQEQLDVLRAAVASWINVWRICRSNTYTNDAAMQPIIDPE
jgi:hypothetical protein